MSANGSVLAVGGLGENHNALTSAELYEASSDAWSAAGSMSVARAFFQMIVLADGTVLVAGGFDSNDDPISSSERFDPATNVWTAVGSMAVSRGAFQMVSM